MPLFPCDDRRVMAARVRRGVAWRRGVALLIALGALIGLSHGGVRAATRVARVLGMSDGLPHETVWCVLRDRRGFIWIGTSRGLARLDATGIVSFGTRDGLPDPVVNDLLEDRRGRLWVATNGGGLARLRVDAPPASARATGAAAAVATNAAASAATTDAVAGGVAGAAAAGSRLFDTFRIGPDRRANRINTLLAAPDGAILAGTDAGLYRLAPDAIADVEPAAETAAARGGERQRGSNDRRSGAAQPIVFAIPGAPDTTLAIFTIVPDRRGDLWIGTNAGLIHHRPGRGTRLYRDATAPPRQLTRAIVIEPDGRLLASFDRRVIAIAAPTPPPARGAIEERFTAEPCAAGGSSSPDQTSAEERAGEQASGRQQNHRAAASASVMAASASAAPADRAGTGSRRSARADDGPAGDSAAASPDRKRATMAAPRPSDSGSKPAMPASPITVAPPCLAALPTAGAQETIVDLLRPASDRTLVVTAERVIEARADGHTTQVFDAGADMITTAAHLPGEGVWIGTRASGLVQLRDTPFEAFDTSDGLDALYVRHLFADRDGSLYAMTANWTVARFTPPSSSGATAGTTSPSAPARFVTARPRGADTWGHTGWMDYIVRTRRSGWWATMAEGLVQFPDVPLEALPHTAPIARHALAARLAGGVRMRGLFEDSRGDIWAGTLSGDGRTVLTRWQRASGTLRHYTVADGLEPYAEAALFIEDRAGRVWVSFRDGGIARIDESRVVMVRDETAVPGAAGAVRADAAPLTVAIAEAGRGATTPAAAPSHAQAAAAAAAGPATPGPTTPALRTTGTTAAAAAGAGATTPGAALSRAQASAAAPSATPGSAAPALRTTGITAAAEAGRGATTPDAALSRAQASAAAPSATPGSAAPAPQTARTAAAAPISPAARSAGPAAAARAFHLDARGRLWLALRVGLARIDDVEAAAPRLVLAPEARALTNDQVTAIAEDRDGRLYFGHAGGIDRLDPRTGAMRTLGPADGLPRGEIRSVQSLPDGTTWFGTSLGAFRFTPGRDEATAPPRVLISGVSVNGVHQWVPPAAAAQLDPLTLADGTAALNLSVAIMPASLASRPRFQYRLVRSGSEPWSEAASPRLLTLSYPSPGRYRLEVRALGPDGQTSAQAAVLPFRVLAPVWRRPWFLALAGVSIAAALFLLHRYRLAQALRLERIRARIATDLHDDIGASLSHIAILAEVLRSRTRHLPEAAATLDQMAATSRTLVDSMSDIVWSINPRRDALGDLVRRVRRFAEDALESAGVALTFHAPQDGLSATLSPDVRRELLLFVKEGVTNIVRHAQATEAQITLRVDGGAIALTIRDNGCGFDVSSGPAGASRDGAGHDGAGHDGNGLDNLRRRAAALDGDLRIDSVRGRGTTITLTTRRIRRRDRWPFATRSASARDERRHVE